MSTCEGQFQEQAKTSIPPNPKKWKGHILSVVRKDTLWQMAPMREKERSVTDWEEFMFQVADSLFPQISKWKFSSFIFPCKI
jgi:hypothetical protein